MICIHNLVSHLANSSSFLHQKSFPSMISLRLLNFLNSNIKQNFLWNPFMFENWEESLVIVFSSAFSWILNSYLKSIFCTCADFWKVENYFFRSFSCLASDRQTSGAFEHKNRHDMMRIEKWNLCLVKFVWKRVFWAACRESSKPQSKEVRKRGGGLVSGVC